MPTARIITRFPERAAALRHTLIKSGYHVEVVSPEGVGTETADLEYDLEQMPEVAAEAEPQPIREFVFAPQLRAMKSWFVRRPENLPHAVERRALPLQPPVVADLDKHFVDEPASGPTLAQRFAAWRAPIAAKLQSARTQVRQRATAFEQQRAAHRAAAEERRRLRELELVEKREADRVAAERARAEAALRLQQQQERESKRLAEIQAQLELRRREQAEAEERARLQAQERLRLQAEEHARLEAERQALSALTAASANTEPVQEPHHHVRRRFTDFQERAKKTVQDWREVQSSKTFPNTREYAWRQAIPLAAGVALAFALGWAAAIGASNRPQTTPATTSAGSTADVQQQPAAPVATAVKNSPARPKVQKPSAASRRTNASKTKRIAPRRTQVEEAEDDGPEVVVYHYPSKAVMAQSGKKKGTVKSISDID